MTRTAKVIILSLMAVAMAGIVAAVSPQVFAAQNATDASFSNAETSAITAPQSDVVDAYNWRTTISPTVNPSVPPKRK